MTTLVGKTITPYNNYVKVKILSISDTGEYYNCINMDTGRPFQALKKTYDGLFIPKVDKEIKPLHYKGESDHKLVRNRR